jgi:hypothetical protein
MHTFPVAYWGNNLHKANCLGWWSFSSGATLTDSSGNGNSLTVQNAGSGNQSTSSGFEGYGWNFGAGSDNTNLYTAVNSAFAPSTSKSISVVGWVKLGGGTSTEAYNSIFGLGPDITRGSGGYAPALTWQIHANASSVYTSAQLVYLSGASSQATSGAPLPPVGSWAMIAMGWDAVQSKYWSWCSSSLTAKTLSGVITLYAPPNPRLQIGSIGSTGAFDQCPGAVVDEVSVWNVPLSIAQLQWLYNNGSGRQYSGLLT